MLGMRTRRFPVPMRPLVVVLLGVCLQGSAVPGFQAAQAQTFPRSAWTAIAHGKLTEAESAARAQPSGDVDAIAILGHLAIRKGQYDEAVKLLEPAASQSPV